MATGLTLPLVWQCRNRDDLSCRWNLLRVFFLPRLFDEYGYFPIIYVYYNVAYWIVLKAATQKFAMATEPEQASKGINHDAYNAAVSPGTKIESSKLRLALNSTTPGGGNTLLHLAASVGNLPFIQQLLELNRELLKATNAQGNTALHLAAQGGFLPVVEHILKQDEISVAVGNKLKETALFKACESGDIDTVEKLLEASPSSLRQRAEDERTCLYVAINRGDSGHCL